MSEKGRKKKTSKNNKKATKAKKTITLRLHDGTTVNANDVDTNKIKVFDKKLYSKIHDLYKCYVFYEHDNKHIPLNIFLSNVTGCYHSFNNGSKSTNFILNDDLLEKIYEIFIDIEAKLGIEINDFTITNSHGTSLKTKISKGRTCLHLQDISKNRICFL